MTNSPKLGKKKVKEGLPWYRYRSVWLMLIVLPLFALGASIATIYIASTSNLAGGAHESYYKKGLSPNELAPREQLAKERGLAATFSIEPQGIFIRFNQPLKQKDLTIKFQHPTLESRDFTLPLQAKGTENRDFFVARPDNLRENKWDIFVDSEHNDWRVKGRLLEEEIDIDLTPFGQ